MSDATDSEAEIGHDVPVEEDTSENVPMPLQARICLTSGALVLLSGLLIGFGTLDWYVSLWSAYPGWSSLLTAVIVLVPGLFFDRTRSIAFMVLLTGVLLFVLFWMAVFSGYGWYVFFTTGMHIDGKSPLIISKTGGALIIAGIAMLVVCAVIHIKDGVESILCRAAAGVACFILATSSVLFLLSIISEPMLKPVENRRLTVEEISTLKDCEVRDGSTKVRCFLPEAAKLGADR